jgi:predicted Rossmann fold flavoprotein
MAAIHAADSGARVLLLERTKDGGRKIVMSGGGRCNVLPSEIDPTRFVTASSANTMKKMLLAWPLAEQRAFFEVTLGIQLALERETGKLFPVSNRSRDVRDRLVAAAVERGVEIRFGGSVSGLEPRPGEGWTIRFDHGPPLSAARVVLASGGLSVPATGSDGTGLDIARRLGHTIHETYPALTPLTARPHRFADLSGVSLSVALEAPANGKRFISTGGFLFTHKGYSGPSVLNLSHLCVQAARARREQPVYARWTDLDRDAWDRELREGEGTVAALLRARMPARLAEALLRDAGVPGTTAIAQLRREERGRLAEHLARYPLPWNGDEGYVKAEVTGGGVALEDVQPRTLESKIHPGLFLCGEILDAFGPIGGYNFAWAWSTGRSAGTAAARS